MLAKRLVPLSYDEKLGLFEWCDPRAQCISHRGSSLLPAFFDELSRQEHLPDIMNDTYATRKTSKVFLPIRLHNLAPRMKGIGQNQMLDFDRKKLDAVGSPGTSMMDALKNISEEVTQLMLDVMEYAESSLVPEVFRELSDRLGFDLTQFLRDAYVGYRFLDYPARECSTDQLMRCDDHTDTSAITIIIQCGVTGLEAEDSSGDWVPIPGDRIVVMLGTVGQILSNDVLQAPVHRVVDAPTQAGVIPRRNSVVIFIDADPQTPLQPHMQHGQTSRFRTDIPLPGDLKMQLYRGVAVFNDFRVKSMTTPAT